MLLPVDTLRINPTSYTGWIGTLPTGTPSKFATYQQAMKAGVKNAQPDLKSGPISHVAATAGVKSAALNPTTFIQGQVQKTREGFLNQTAIPAPPTTEAMKTPGTEKAKKINVTAQKPKIPKTDEYGLPAPQSAAIQGAMSNSNERMKKTVGQ